MTLVHLALCWAAFYVLLGAYIALKLYQTRRRHSEARPLAPDAPPHRRPLPPTSAGRASGRRYFNRDST